MKCENMNIKDYLNKKGILYKEKNGELITNCIFNNCDSNSMQNEAHLYFSVETGQYNCKKCGEKGNLLTLLKHFGDSSYNNYTSKKASRFNPELVNSCHQNLPNHIRQYLNSRGLPDHIIDAFELGWGEFYEKKWITIPIKNDKGEYI